MPYLLIIGIVDALLLIEPHYSATILTTAVAFIILFTAGAKIWHFIIISIPVIPLGIYFIVTEEYRLRRVLTFIDPFDDPTDAGYQIVNSLYAIGSGGIFGKGIGQSVQKNLYIRHTPIYFLLLLKNWVSLVQLPSSYCF